VEAHSVVRHELIEAEKAQSFVRSELIQAAEALNVET
jgi:hypothetical protein